MAEMRKMAIDSGQQLAVNNGGGALYYTITGVLMTIFFYFSRAVEVVVFQRKC